MYSTLSMPGELHSTLSNLTATGKSKSREASLCVAYAISRRLMLPTEPLMMTAVEPFFNANLKAAVRQTIDQVNEAVLIDCTTVCDYVLALYKFRVNAAFPPDCMFLGNPKTAVCDFLGASKSIDPAMMCDIEANTHFVSTYVTVFVKLLNHFGGQ